MTPRTRGILRFALVALVLTTLATDTADARRRRHRQGDRDHRGGRGPEAQPRRHGEPPGGGGDGTGSQSQPQAACQGHRAGQFPCEHVDLMARVSVGELAGNPAATLNDIWGWTDPSNGHEIAIVGLSTGVAFVDVSDPAEPEVLARMPTRTLAAPWRDIKVYRDHAYVVADGAAVHGMQVFDLTALRSVGGNTPNRGPDRIYFGAGGGASQGETLGSAHNIAIDEEAGFAYVLGSSTCNGGLHIVNLRRPDRPRFAGCFSADGYTHDAQCVVYRGPDQRYRNHEMCFAANEDSVTIVDVSDKRDPQMVARVGYQESSYVHQMWLTENHRFLISNDELDELQRGVNTRTFIWDVRDLDNPTLIGVHEGPTHSTDHNLYVRGNLVYAANYRRGLRIFSLDRVAQGRLDEVASFDIDPGSDAPGFDGAWSVYPYFPSGTVVVSGITQGLFVLRPDYGELP